MAIKRSGRVHRTVAAGAVGAAALALLMPAVPAAAKTVTVVGVGAVEVPDDIPVPGGIPGVEVDPAPAPLPALGESAGRRAVDAALTKIGAPYSWGAAGPDAFDCSGLVQWSYEQAGIEVPRTSYDQLGSGLPVSLDNLEPGDVVSFYDGSHSGLYVGDGNIVHASDYGRPVDIAPLYSMPVAGVRRY